MESFKGLWMGDNNNVNKYYYYDYGNKNEYFLSIFYTLGIMFSVWYIYDFFINFVIDEVLLFLFYW